MSDPKQARLLLQVAEEDLDKLRAREDESVFVDRMFGFTVQQAAEKLLKARICLLGLAYPLTHDLGTLMELLSEHGEDMDRFASLVSYTGYAGVLRYQPVDSRAERLDREPAIALVEALLEHVKTLAAKA